MGGEVEGEPSWLLRAIVVVQDVSLLFLLTTCLLEGASGCGLDDGSVSEGIRVGAANLDDVSAQLVQLEQSLLRGGQVGIAGADEGDEGNPTAQGDECKIMSNV